MTNSLVPKEDEYLMVNNMSKMLVKTGFLPAAINTPEKAVSIILKGRELNIPPMQALSQISVIKGKPTISAELMLALIYRNCPGCEIIWTDLNNSVAACKVRRNKETEFQKFSFSMEDAKTAKIMGKDNWKNYPRAMLRSRCISEMARSVFPDSLMGASYTPEEMGADYVEPEVIKVDAFDARAFKLYLIELTTGLEDNEKAQTIAGHIAIADDNQELLFKMETRIKELLNARNL